MLYFTVTLVTGYTQIANKCSRDLVPLSGFSLTKPLGICPSEERTYFL